MTDFDDMSAKGTTEQTRIKMLSAKGNWISTLLMSYYDKQEY